MRIQGWARAFQEQDSVEDIPARLRDLEVRYWVWLAVSGLAVLVGAFLIAAAPDVYPKQMFIGLFVAVAGLVGIGAVKLWAAIYLCLYRVLQELRDRDLLSRPGPGS